MKLKRVGLSGIGGHFADHLVVMAEAGLLPTDVFDPNRAKAAERLAEKGYDPTAITWHDSEAGMLASDIDGVMVGSPDRFHLASLLAALRAGKPTLVEKPPADSPEQLAALAEACDAVEQTGVPFTTCLPRYFDPAYIAAHQRIGELEQQLGALRHLTLDFAYPTPGEAWKEDRSLGLDHALHELFELRRYRRGARFVVSSQEDSALRYFANGCFEPRRGIDEQKLHFTLIGTRETKRIQLAPGERDVYPEKIIARFTEGEAIFLLHKMQPGGLGRLHWRHKRSNVFNVELTPATDYDKRLLGIMENFAGMIDGEPSYISPAEIYSVTAAAMAISTEETYES